MASGGGTIPRNRKRFVKNGKCNEYDFLYVLHKSSWTTFKTILETLSALGTCHIDIEGVVYRKSMISEVFWEYIGRFLIFLREIFFGSKILSRCCDKHQKKYGCSSYPGNVAAFLLFWVFLDLFVLAQAFRLGHFIFLRNLSQCIYFQV